MPPAEPVLYVYPGGGAIPSVSPPCAKVVLALAYAQLPHRVEPVFGMASKVSPTGRLPALALDAEVVVDSVAILDRLEALELPRPISPSEPRARAQDRLWEHYVNDTLYWHGLYLRWCVPENHRRLMDQILGRRLSFKKLVAKPLITREVMRRVRGQGIGLKSEAQVRASLTRAFELLDAALPASGFLAGEAPGRGDFALAAVMSQVDFRGLTPKVAEEVRRHPRLLDHARAVFAACGLEELS